MKKVKTRGASSPRSNRPYLRRSQDKIAIIVGLILRSGALSILSTCRNPVLNRNILPQYFGESTRV